MTHARLLVSDVPRSIAFYRSVLGVEPVFQMETYADFDAGGGHVALYDRALMAKSLGSAFVERSAGVDTIALIFAVDDVDAAYRHLAAQGCEFVGKPVDRAEWGVRTAHFRDPDGNLIEINKELTAR